MLLGNYFYKYDFRTSHNYYFSTKSMDHLIKKAGLKVEKKIGYHEYDFNHLLAYANSKKRVTGTYKKIFNQKNEIIFKRNIENSFTSTSLLYILK